MWKLRTPSGYTRTNICLVQVKEMQGMEIITCMLVMVAVLRTVLTAKRRYSNTAVEFPPLRYYIVSVYRLYRTFPLAGTRAHMCAGACMRVKIPSPLVIEGSAPARALRCPRPAPRSGLPSPLVHHRKGKPLKG